MLVSRQALEVWRASSNDGGRYSLCGVLFEADGSAVATNGHWLAKFTPARKTDALEFPHVEGCNAASPGELIPFIMPLDSLKALLKSLPKRQTLPVLEYAALDVEQTNANGHAVLAVTDLENPQVSKPKKVEGTFPMYQNVIPTDGQLGEAVGFSAHYLKAICETAIAQNGKGGTTFLTLRLHKEDAAEKPAVLTYTGDAGETTFVLMPVNLK